MRTRRIIKDYPVTLSDNTIAYLRPREYEVLLLLTKYKGAKQIAHHLNRSCQTINVHIVNIKKKLKVNNLFHLGHIFASLKLPTPIHEVDKL